MRIKMRTARVAGIGLMAASMLVAGCGGSYDRAEFIAELEGEQGIDGPTAECIAIKVEEQIGVDRLNDRGKLTTEEEAILTDVAIQCVLGS